MSEQQIRIVSYNIRKARGLDQRRDPGRILDVINALEGDIVVLQEADRRLGVRKPALPPAMIEAQSDYRIAPVARNGVSLGWHGNAVLVRPGIEVAEVAHLALPGLEPRGAVMLRLGGALDLSLVATHLALRRRDRLAQQATIAAAVPEERPAIIAGDFNEWAPRSGFETPGARYTVHAPGRSFHASRPVAALDRFALSPEIDLRDAGVDTGPTAARASDHLPIWCRVSVPAEGTAQAG
ncbi:endonuclease/exonuclease/phosphatase family protein [Poseidonocella sedimentorum]|uniref:Metal-dependent hydrolase, endonuclease/exonuclease/phosphatase family n=1 Tax=Poseidonocella sedimentorum TaxID=871652 RepID=A0A1I6DVA2_9RHOB|nr:endonuclease/exonuclease/phosphatase family protein [Poseidonocella sedimentorum]SFR09440.1 Metal-dependent hydrolase, endonuclease/exonuclease/phosphatase family [Poseidonocella sedimentorum]